MTIGTIGRVIVHRLEIPAVTMVKEHAATRAKEFEGLSVLVSVAYDRPSKENTSIAICETIGLNPPHRTILAYLCGVCRSTVGTYEREELNEHEEISSW